MAPGLCLALCGGLGGCAEDAIDIPTADLGASGDLPDVPADLAGDGAPAGDLALPPMKPDLSKLVPWKAVNFAGPTRMVWQEYDYRPKAQGGWREDIDARLEQLKAIGVRQVQIQTWFAWSVETAGYPEAPAIQSTVYYNPAYRPDNPATWGQVPRTRRGDMGLVPWLPPTSWDSPTPLRTPLEFHKKAEAVLGDMLEAVAAHGLVPVLKSEIYLMLAEDGSRTSSYFNFTDPSRNFDQFFKMYQEHLVSLARVAAQHKAALFILGTETPYVAGGGQSYFADGSRMTSRQALITARWKTLIQAVRDTARAEGRGDLALSYTEINPFWEERRLSEARVAPWTRTPFWDDLDAVGINLYLPGRSNDGNGNYDTGPKTVNDMVVYGETHNFASDYVGNFQDLKNFFASGKGYSLAQKPVLIVEDGCTSSRAAAANPALPPFLVVGRQPDFAEQQKLYEAHFRLFEKYGAGWLAGLGFWQVTPTLRWGGAWNANNTANYREAAAYFSFVGTPTEATVKTYFARY